MAFWVVEKTQFPAFEKYQSQIQNAIKKKQESGADPFETTMDVVTAVAKALGCTLENHEHSDAIKSVDQPEPAEATAPIEASVPPSAPEPTGPGGEDGVVLVNAPPSHLDIGLSDFSWSDLGNTVGTMILGPSGNSGLKSLAGKIDPKKAGEILLGILGAIDKGIDDADELFNPGSGPDLPKPLGPDDIPEIPDGMVNQVKVKI